MSKRTLVGSYGQAITGNGAGTQKEHIIFAYEAMDQNKAWKIIECQVWLNNSVIGGGDSRLLLEYCLTTDFLAPPTAIGSTAFNDYALQYNASDNRGIAWGSVDYHLRDSLTDFRIPTSSVIPHAMIADDRRAINYLILNTILASEGSAVTEANNKINYRIIMEQEKVTPTESIVHQIRGMAQDVDN